MSKEQTLVRLDKQYDNIGPYIRDEMPDLDMNWGSVGHGLHQEICDNDRRMRSILSKIEMPIDTILRYTKAVYQMGKPSQDPVEVIKDTITQIYLCQIFPRDTFFREISDKWTPKDAIFRVFAKHLYCSETARALRNGFCHGTFWFDEHMAFHFSTRDDDNSSQRTKHKVEWGKVQMIQDLSRLLLTSIAIWIDFEQNGK